MRRGARTRSRSGIVESTSKLISKFYIYFRSIDNLIPTPRFVTSQIVLMNSHGVAMASDSAVTYGDDRTFDRVNKIFHMGGDHEISFIISGNAIFSPGGIAWPRVIGLFSNHIGPEPLKTVDEYTERLRIFLEESQEINDKLQNDISVRTSLSKWFRSIPPVMELFHWLDLIDGSTQSGSAYMEGFDWEDARTKFREGFEKWMDWIESEFLGKNAKEMKDSFDADWDYNLKRVKDECGESIHFFSAVISEQLEPRGIPIDSSLIQKFAEFHIARSMDYSTHSKEKSMIKEWTGACSTVGIVGFGSSEYAPKMFEIEVGPRFTKEEGCSRVVSEFVIRRRDSEFDDGSLRELCDNCESELVPAKRTCNNCGPRVRQLLSAGAFLKPFAMQSEIQSTLNGIHEDLNFLLRESGTIAENLATWIKADLSGIKGIGDKTMELIDREFHGIEMRMKGYVRDHLWDSIEFQGKVARRQKFREITSGLPMPEMADFAKTLVKLQAEICFYTEKVRAVGGEIDVSIITKEDGCKWIDRKN